MPIKFYSWLRMSSIAALLLLLANITNAQMYCGWQIYAPYGNPVPGVYNPAYILSSSGTPWQPAITNVTTTGGIINIAGPTTGYTMPYGYSYYSGTGNLCKANAGSTVSVIIKYPPPSTYYGRVAVYVDWNHNGVFESGDIVTIPSSASLVSNVPGNLCTVPVLVPLTAQNGLTRMRVRLAAYKTGGAPFIAGPCDTIEVGETEDYDFEVVNPCYEPAVISVSNISCSSADVAWSTRGNATFYDVWVDTILAPWSRYDAPDCYPVGGPFCTQNPTPPLPVPCYCKWWHQFGATQTSTSLPGPVNAHLQPNKKYYVCIRSICDTFNKPLFWTWDTSANYAIDSFTTLPCCETPVVTVTNTTSTTATFSWNAVFTAHGYEYSVGTTHANPAAKGTVMNGTSVTIPGLTSSKTYYFYLRALCSPTPTSDWGETGFATQNTTAILNNGDVVHDLYAYPNPVKNMLTIEADGVMHKGASVTITDITGKLVQSLKMSDQKINVNTSTWAPGFYMIKYSDEVSNKVIKITKE